MDGKPLTDLSIMIKNEVSNVYDREILKSFYLFNKSAQKTNFYNINKSALGYRLDPETFLDKKKYPEIPFGIFMFIGREFRGFHVRFRDISRGGIRLILSNKDNYEHNRFTQF